jgi:serine/threonine-protein kinase
MGEVWKARDTRLNRVVAIKILKAGDAARFAREGQAIAALNHPHICQIYDVGPDYLVMEYIEGQPVRGPLPTVEALRTAIQIADALEAAHKRGILHRDLKPGNLLVTESGVKLLDFGLAKLMMPGPDDSTASIEGAVLGTPAYMAPEQAQGKTVDQRSDVFSFGAVLYEMVSGRRAFGGESLADTLSAVMRDTPAPLDSPMAAIVTRCLAKRPDQRFQTMADLKAALEECIAKPREQQPSIAVLPFANMSGDKEQEYFSDGLAEEIINALAQLPGLKVTARTSAFAFRGKEQDIRRIGEALGVRNILEGSVRRSGSRLRVTAQLISVADGYHLWSERFEREVTDVFAVQDEITAAVTSALRGKLTGKPDETRAYEPNLAAWEAYLRGRHHLMKASPDGIARAKVYFEEAIALDPQWAGPHTALGNVLYFLAVRGLHPISEMVPLARAEARKALELLPVEPGAHALLASLAGMYDYDWKAAEEHFRLSMASGSPPAWIRGTYSQYFLTPLARFEEAIEECAKVIAVDPLNVASRLLEAGTLICAGKYDSAIAKARMILELDDKSHMAHFAIAQCYFFKGRPAEAREPAEEAFRLAPWDRVATAFLAGLLKQQGEEERAGKLLSTIGGIVPAGAMFLYHIVCSEIDSAIDWYEQAIEHRQPGAPMFALSSFVKPLRASPRWPRLARMMNLPAISRTPA